MQVFLTHLFTPNYGRSSDGVGRSVHINYVVDIEGVQEKNELRHCGCWNVLHVDDFTGTYA